MDNELVLNEKDLSYAQVTCATIDDVSLRNKAVANVIAARTAFRYFMERQYQVDSESGLHNIPQFIAAEDISDIYVNGAYIDVRVYFSQDEISVPKSHFDKGIEPVAYMFIKLAQDLSVADVKGFIRPADIDKTNLSDGYYYLDENSLCSLSEVESLLKSLPEDEVPNEKIYQFLEGSLNENDVINMLRLLITSYGARKTMIKAVRAQAIYKMVSTPARQEKSETIESQELTEADLDDLFLDDAQDVESDQESKYTTDVTPSGTNIIDELNNETSSESEDINNSEQIDSLFNGEQKGVPVPKKKGSGGFLMFILIVLLACAGGYWWYMNMYSGNSENTLSDESIPSYEEPVNENINKPQDAADAMPIETVDVKKDTIQNKEEGNAIAIPAIEHSLDASVLVSNLKVDWEVPAGYASNTSAKRYLIKLGKKIQLSLKADLLLLTKPPIANKITVELTFDNNTGKFKFVGIKDSSGEKSVDNAIAETVKAAIESSTNSNNEVFGKLQGNPLLIIRL